MRCPKCGNNNCDILTDVDVKTKGYGLGEGCCGYILLGPIGFLCGACGMGESKTKTKHYGYCQDCGHKFRAHD